jgi:hypothetical protein
MNVVIDRSRCVVERLSQVLFFQERVLPKNLTALPIGGQNLQHAANGDPHSTNARFTPALPSFDSDAFKSWNVGHVFYYFTGIQPLARKKTGIDTAGPK